jgi:glyoxylase-like metal-dependent hydrolase (beta-lactamase superfamily II)
MPVTVIRSHLHYDHVGAVGRFERTALLDSLALRARSHNSLLTLERYEFLGFIQDLAPPTLRVDEWWPADSTVDLGNRRIRVVATPGHTPSSVSLYDEQRRQAFVGDFVIPVRFMLSIRARAAAPTAYATRWRSTQSRISAHMADPPAPVRARCWRG